MRRPDALVLAVFAVIVLVGGTNFVAVRFSNRELPPFWGAGIRFAAASALLFVLAAQQRIALPRGAALVGAVVYGVLSFGASYAFAYWGLLEAPAALASAVVALAPLLTFFFAVALAMERFHWRGVVGGLIAAAGVAVVFADQLRATVSAASLLALLATAVAIAASTIVAKRLGRVHPVSTNAVAMVPGAALLLALSVLAREPLVVPTQTATQLALLYLVLGTPVLFVGFLFVVERWTASATSYATVLFPIVTAAIGFVLAGEAVTPQFVLGTALVMAGVYAGAIAQPAPRPAVAAPAPGTSWAGRP